MFMSFEFLKGSRKFDSNIAKIELVENHIIMIFGIKIDHTII